MFMYFTGGTEDYLKKLFFENGQETFTFMHHDDVFMLAHETEGNSLFKEPKKYEVIDASGTITVPSGFVACNHIPVFDESRPLFEYRFKDQARLIEKEPGFLAFRVLRPLRYDTYMIFTIWNNEAAYNQWKKSKSILDAHGEKKAPISFPRPSFITTYKIYEEEE